MRILGIIPARSGSKSLKDKNIKILAGKPLMAYSIEAAISSEIFETVMVSTDSVQYAQIAKKYGAEVPFLRSESTSLDTSTTRETVLEVLDQYKTLGKVFDTICILQPTSPLRTADHIRAAFVLYRKRHAKAVISVCEVDHSPLWANTLGDNYSLKAFIKKGGNQRRQQIEKYYRINGAIYMIDVGFYYENENLYVDDSYAYIMNREESIDIDTQLDFDIAEFLQNRRNVYIAEIES